jgi:peptidoglycan/xylan/chitin deacetylase (PgdA/CDA1 family)
VKFFWGRKDARKVSIPILIYHNLTYDKSKWDGYNVSPDKFRQELLYLKNLGYNTIDFGEYVNYIEGSRSLPDNPCIVTFDDGYLSNYEYAYPILKELGMKATISIIAEYMPEDFGFAGKPGRLTWEQAKEMYESGLIDIQCHSYNLHNINGNIIGIMMIPKEKAEQYEKRFKEDTLRAKKMIESKIGNKVSVYTYPYGVYNKTSEDIIKDLGFKVSLTTLDGISEAGTYLLRRINMPNKKTSLYLVNRILKLQNKDLEKELTKEILAQQYGAINLP